MNTMQTTQLLPTNWRPSLERSELPVHAVMAGEWCRDRAASKAVTAKLPVMP